MTANSAYYAPQLRLELAPRNRAFTLQRQLLHSESRGGMSVPVYFATRRVLKRQLPPPNSDAFVPVVCLSFVSCVPSASSGTN